MTLKDSIMIVDRDIIREYTEFYRNDEADTNYLVIRNRKVESMLEKYKKVEKYDGYHPDVAEYMVVSTKPEFLNNSIYGVILGYDRKGNTIMNVSGDDIEDKSLFDIQVNNILIPNNISKFDLYIYKMVLKK